MLPNKILMINYVGNLLVFCRKLYVIQGLQATTHQTKYNNSQIMQLSILVEAISQLLNIILIRAIKTHILLFITTIYLYQHDNSIKQVVVS